MFQNGLMNVQQDFNSLTQTSTNIDPNALQATGHQATFMYYGHYYPKLGSGSGAGRTGHNTMTSGTGSGGAGATARK